MGVGGWGVGWSEWGLEVSERACVGVGGGGGGDGDKSGVMGTLAKNEWWWWGGFSVK